MAPFQLEFLFPNTFPPPKRLRSYHRSSDSLSSPCRGCFCQNILFYAQKSSGSLFPCINFLRRLVGIFSPNAAKCSNEYLSPVCRENPRFFLPQVLQPIRVFWRPSLPPFLPRHLDLLSDLPMRRTCRRSGATRDRESPCRQSTLCHRPSRFELMSSSFSLAGLLPPPSSSFPRSQRCTCYSCERQISNG